MRNIDIRDFPVVAAVDLTDYAVVSLFSGTSARVKMELFQDVMTGKITPKIGEDGYWYIGEQPTTVMAKGLVPEFRKVGPGIEYKYNNEDDEAWRPLVSYDDLRLRYIELTPEQVYSMRMRYEDLSKEQQDTLRLKFEDLTEEQVADLKKPATEIAELVAKAEEERVLAESGRMEAEEKRVQSEEERKEIFDSWSEDYGQWSLDEEVRKNNEVLRNSGETGRRVSEVERVEAEQARSDAESVREENDRLRQQWFEEIKSQLGNQTLALEFAENGDLNVITGETNTDFRNGYIEENGDVVLEFSFW